MVPYASQTWSIGTEEQYYLVWPIILKNIKKYRILTMACIIFVSLAFKMFLLTRYANIIPHKNALIAFLDTFKIECMAIGGIYSTLLFQKSNFLKFLLHNTLFMLVIFFVLFLMIKGVSIPYIRDEVYSVLFGIIILNFAANNKIKISLENKLLNYLGNISYGLYMYHSIGIVLAFAIATSINYTKDWLLYPLSFILTIILAGLSYRYYETYFLSFKHKFSKIMSGNAIKE